MSRKNLVLAIKTLVLSIIGIVVFIFCEEIIWTTDCLAYQYSFATGEKIKSVSDIIESQYVHYFICNGRYVAHFLCQLFLSILGKTAFSVFDALFTILLILLVLRITKASNGLKEFFTACIVTLLFLDTEYGPTCQIGYLWMSCLSLAFLLVFFCSYHFERRGMVWKVIGLFLFSVIAGNGQEAINMGFGGALFIYFIYNFKKLSPYQWSMLCGFALGFLILCLSPANFGRLDENDIPLIPSLLYLIQNLRVTYLFLLVLLFEIIRKRTSLKEFYKGNSFFVNALLIGIIFNLFIGVGSNRQLLGVELCASILTVSLLRYRGMGYIGLIGMGLITIYVFTLKYHEIMKSKQTYEYLKTVVATRTSDVIYADFPQFSMSTHSTPYIRHGVYFDYIIESILKELNDTSTNLKVYPTCIKNVMVDSIKDQYFEYLPNEYILLQSRDHPKIFILERELNIFGISIPLPLYIVSFDQNSRLNTEDYNILYLPQISPFILNTNIRLE